MRKLIVTGGRDFKDSALVMKVLGKLSSLSTLICVGDCPTGVDAYVEEIFRNVKVYKADWNKYGKAAGPIRNRQMCEENQDAILIAFPGGRGTEDCKTHARALDIPILEVSAFSPTSDESGAVR